MIEELKTNKTNNLKYQIAEKAWVLDNSNLYEPWFHNDDIIYYGTRGQAKKRAFTDNDAGRLSNGDDVSFLTIKVKRSIEDDKIIINDNIIKRSELKQIERLDNISKLPKNKFFYVQDRRNYIGNAVLWWAKNSRGYVTDISKAHKYTWDEIQSFNPRESDIIWESEHVESAIRQYVDSQYLNREFSF